MGFLFGQSNIDFRFDTYVDGDFVTHADNIIESTAMWIGNSAPVWMEENQRFYGRITGIQQNKITGYQLSLPHFSAFVKASKNLVLSLKVVGFSINEDSPQILGGGIRLNLGDKENPKWQFIAERIHISGLRDFRLNTTSLSFARKFIFWNITSSFGFGVNAYKASTFSQIEAIPKNINKEINFISLHSTFPIRYFEIGFGLKLYTHVSTIQFSLAKGFR